MFSPKISNKSATVSYKCPLHFQLVCLWPYLSLQKPGYSTVRLKNTGLGFLCYSYIQDFPNVAKLVNKIFSCLWRSEELKKKLIYLKSSIKYLHCLTQFVRNKEEKGSKHVLRQLNKHSDLQKKSAICKAQIAVFLIFLRLSLSLSRWECDEERFQSVRPWAAPRPSRCRPCPTMRRDAARPTAMGTSSLVRTHTHTRIQVHTRTCQ